MCMLRSAARSVLETTGILAHVVGPNLRAHLGDLLSLIIDALQDAGEGRKRDMAVLTLAQVASMSTLSIELYAHLRDAIRSALIDLRAACTGGCCL